MITSDNFTFTRKSIDNSTDSNIIALLEKDNVSVELIQQSNNNSKETFIIIIKEKDCLKFMRTDINKSYFYNEVRLFNFMRKTYRKFIEGTLDITKEGCLAV